MTNDAGPTAPAPATTPVLGWRERLAAAVFPEIPPSTHPWRAAVTAGALGAIASLVFALRLPFSVWDRLWAEDGYTFFQAALGEPWWRSLLEPWAGYLHLYPRVAGEVAVRFPVAEASYVFVGLSALAVGLVVAGVWRLSAGLLTSAWLRLVLVAGIVLVPGGGLEAVGNVANSHWFLVFGALWALAGRPSSRGLVVGATGLVTVAALSDPLCLLLLPLAVARVLALPAWRDRVVVVAYVVAMALQVAVALSSPRETGEPVDPAELLSGYALRVVATTVTGLRATRALVADGSWAGVYWVTAATVLVALAAVAVARGRRLVVLGALASSVVHFAAPALFPLAGTQFPPPGAAQLDLSLGGRYTILPSLFLLAGLLVAVQTLLDRTRWGRAGHVALLALASVPVLLWAATDYRPVPDLRTATTPWSQEVEQFRDRCASDRGTPPTRITIEPGGLTWVVELTCDQVRG